MKKQAFLLKAFIFIVALLIAGSISACAGGADILDILLGSGQPPAPSGDGDDGAARVPGAPMGVTAARNPADSTDVRVSWNAVSGATGYRVYWSETYSGTGTLKGSPTTTSFTSTGNNTNATHYFRVTAVNSAGEGTSSPWVSVGPVASAPAPSTPSIAGDGGPTNWTLVSNSRFGDYGIQAVAYDGKMAYCDW
jgi:hypothetical protein